MSTPAAETPAAVSTPPPTATPANAGTPATVPPTPSPIPVPVEGADDVTITSTTDTLAEVQAALEHKVPDAPASAANTTPAAGTETPKTEGTPAAAPPPAPDPASEAGKVLGRRKQSLQERIDEVTFQREDARRALEAQQAENARIRAENEAYRAGKTPAGTATPPAKAPETPPKPLLKDYDAEPDPYAAWTEALTDWKADRREEKLRTELEGKIATDRQADQARTEEERAAEANQRAMQAFGQRSLAYRERMGGEKYDQEVAQIKADVASGAREEQIYPQRMMIHVTRSEMGPALIHHFAQHPDVFREIAAMHDTAPNLMLVALGRLEGKLEASLPAKGSAAPATPSTPATRAVDALASSSIAAAPVSAAPPPPTLVGSGASAATVPLDQMDFQDFKALRNAQERKRR